MIRMPSGMWALLLALVLCGSAAGQSLSVRADYWFPVNGHPDSEQPGFAIEILKAIFEPVGITVDYRLSSWSRSLEMARIGRIDCIVGAYVSDAPELLLPATAFAVDDLAFYVRTGSDWRYSGFPSLEPMVMGVIADYSYGRALDAYFAERRGDPNLQFLHGQEPLQRNLQKLIAGRVDVVLESPLVMEAMLRQRELHDQVREAGRMGIEERLYLACSPERDTSPRILKLFDEGMEKLHQRGELRDIMGRYGLDASVHEWSRLRAQP